MDPKSTGFYLPSKEPTSFQLDLPGNDEQTRTEEERKVRRVSAVPVLSELGRENIRTVRRVCRIRVRHCVRSQ